MSKKEEPYRGTLKPRRGEPRWLRTEKELIRAKEPAKVIPPWLRKEFKPLESPYPVEPLTRIGIPKRGREGEEPEYVTVLPPTTLEIEAEAEEVEEVYKPEELERREALRIEDPRGLITEAQPLPGETWKFERVGNDICAEREVEIVQLDPKTAEYDEKEKRWVGDVVRTIKTETQRPDCVHLSRTIDCVRKHDGDLSDCERVKMALACSKDETGAQLTKTMISEVADVSVDKSQQCVSELIKDGLVMTPTQVARTVGRGERVPTYPRDKGEPYFIMGVKKAKDIL